MGIWTYGLHPVHSIGDELAHFVLQVLVPLCALSAFTMYLLLFRLTKRYKIKVYVGSDPMMKKLARFPSFRKDYHCPTWAQAAWIQTFLYLYRSWKNTHLTGFFRELVGLPDGEKVSLHWMFPEDLSPPAHALPPQKTHTGNYSPPDLHADLLAAVEVPPEVPIIVISHGVFQSAPDLYEFATFLTKQCGYVVVVFNRRGNDLPLSRPRFNTVGDQEDFRYILQTIRSRYNQGHRFYGVGISAGSSLLARYLGDSGVKAEFSGAVLISPGYDMELSFRHMNSFADRMITSHAKQHFLQPNHDTLDKHDHTQGALRKLYRSKSMQEFHQHMHVFDGSNTQEEYFRRHNPIYVLDKIRKPIIYLNAYDDPCFPGDFTFQFKYLVDRCQMATILHVDRGGHTTFYEDWDAGSSRAFHVVKDLVQCIESEQARH